jgi:signal peptidase II
MPETPEPSPLTDLPNEPSSEPAELPLVPSPAGMPDAPGVATANVEPTAVLPIDPELERHRPSFLFFGVVAALSLLADVGTKAWAEVVLSRRTLLDPSIVIFNEHLSFTLAYNKGGAWGLLQTASETVRKPFFLIVSVLAIAFIVSLYSRLAPGQRALK